MKLPHMPLKNLVQALSCIAPLLLALTYAQEVSALGTIADGTPSPPSPPKVLPKFNVEATTLHRLADHDVIMQRVTDPVLPDPPPPPPPMSEKEYEALRASEEWKGVLEKHKDSQMLFLSATVYDHKRTFVRWYGIGTPMKCFAAWSNVDFNHLSGLGGFESDGIQYALLMGIGNADTARSNLRISKQTPEIGEPAVPDLPSDRPAFVLVEGDEKDVEGMAPMLGLHQLYTVEKSRLAAAYVRRERARVEREAYLKAHPPTTPDTVIQFWSRKSKKSGAANIQKQEEAR
jgi:hypothetical protein